MRIESARFAERARAAVRDADLETALDRTTGLLQRKRADAVGRFAEFEAAREAAAAIRARALDRLEPLLLAFEENATRAGAVVHWAESASEAAEIVVSIARSFGAKSATRVKSMTGEEIGLPEALEAAGIERIETDLAEHVIQLAGERPSHIVMPAMHKRREQVGALFAEKHRIPPEDDTVEAMVASARRELREKFLAAEVGISGANFLIAQTGAVCTVTNEGNAELTTTPPKVHIVTAGIDKVIADMDEAIALLRVLARSATGADLTQYTTFHCGPRRACDRDGPEAMHVVLIDNRRTAMLGSELRPMLKCIRCAACMNHCVVYQSIGGHPYGSTYPGPMGAVLTPGQHGLAPARDLPHACTGNGRCGEVCPVKIPLPTLIRGLRAQMWRAGEAPKLRRWGTRLWAAIAKRPALYRRLVPVARIALRALSRGGRLPATPFGPITTSRMAAPSGGSFVEAWRRRQGGR